MNQTQNFSEKLFRENRSFENVSDIIFYPSLLKVFITFDDGTKMQSKTKNKEEFTHFKNKYEEFWGMIR
ncbi:hypothetical protein UFOVP80_10 [uncultured Caudovirales phage]|jgi:hypothetical protein|uniref:Uncharacterized protein n=1 Tax=uncultured Caudovirales phage TaxID=2100421 RepID=A0A6J5KWW8_9CAUD|nr:hypothetical protein UFOVP80_10 [uncultured Caudovirales phage]